MDFQVSRLILLKKQYYLVNMKLKMALPGFTIVLIYFANITNITASPILPQAGTAASPTLLAKRGNNSNVAVASTTQTPVVNFRAYPLQPAALVSAAANTLLDLIKKYPNSTKDAP
jgi:hypothetical protein